MLQSITATGSLPVGSPPVNDSLTLT